MAVLYPLRFQPILRRYLWGGRRLETLGKSLGAGNDYAESWEIADHGADQSRVLAGPLAGATLSELVANHGAGLLGHHASQSQFPLLIKFLDAHSQLSLQVHPDDARAEKLAPPTRGKTEAWVILAAEPGSYLFAGLRRGIDRTTLTHEVARHTCEICVERIQPQPGDCFFLPAGVLHALGPGLLVAEVQQTSDVTYRLYDWNRLGPDGKTRALHIDEALDAVDYEFGPVSAAQPQPTDRPFVERLVNCDKFVLDRWKFAQPASAGGDQSAHVIMVLSGAVEVAGDPVSAPLEKGGVVLLPAELGAVELHPRGDTVLLDAYPP